MRCRMGMAKPRWVAERQSSAPLRSAAPTALASSYTCTVGEIVDTETQPFRAGLCWTAGPPGLDELLGRPFHRYRTTGDREAKQEKS